MAGALTKLTRNSGVLNRLAFLLRGHCVCDELLAKPHLPAEPPKPGQIEEQHLTQGEQEAAPGVQAAEVRQFVGENPAEFCKCGILAKATTAIKPSAA